MNLGPYFTPYTKNTSEQIRDNNVGAKAIKLLEENTEVSLCDLTLDNGFLDVTPKAQATKEIIDKQDMIKIKSYCASKDTIKKAKRELTE